MDEERKNAIKNYIFIDMVRKGMCLQNYWKSLAEPVFHGEDSGDHRFKIRHDHFRNVVN
jgi:hypothetical protein